MAAATQGLAVDVRGLVMHFGEVRALDGIDLAIERGSVFGLAGPNGAGKTTAVRLLNGVLDPTWAQTLRVLGEDLPDGLKRVRPRVGVQTDTNLYERLTALQNLTTYGQLYGLEPTAARARADVLLEMFGLVERSADKVSTFSKGMKQKLLIARALIAEPELVYLDEPTAGLDPEASHELMTYIKRMSSADHTTFFITSHRLEEMEDVCTHVAILAGGRIRTSGTPREISRAAATVTRVRVTPAPGAVLDASTLQALPGVTGVATDGDVLVTLTGADAVPQFLRAAAALPVDLHGVAMVEPSLQEAYLSVVAAAESTAPGGERP